MVDFDCAFESLAAAFQVDSLESWNPSTRGIAISDLAFGPDQDAFDFEERFLAFEFDLASHFGLENVADFGKDFLKMSAG